MASAGSPRTPVTAPIPHGSTAGTNVGPLAPQPTGAGTAATDGAEPVLCHHCGRTASNGISCEGACVADSGY